MFIIIIKKTVVFSIYLFKRYHKIFLYILCLTYNYGSCKDNFAPHVHPISTLYMYVTRGLMVDKFSNCSHLSCSLIHHHLPPSPLWRKENPPHSRMGRRVLKHQTLLRAIKYSFICKQESSILLL